MTDQQAASFDTQAFPKEVRAEAWRNFTAAAAIPVPEPSGEFRAWQKRWAGRTLHFRHTFCTGQLAKYRKTRFHDDSVIVCYLQDGPAFAWDGSRKISAKPGEVYILDANSTEAFFIRNTTTMGVTIPYSALAIDRSDAVRATAFRRESAVSNVVSTALCAAFSEPSSPEDDNRELLEDILVSLTKTLIFRNKPDDQARTLLPAVRRDSVRQYIERNLDDLELCSRSLEVAFGVSRATIARDFMEDGGVSRYILKRRLERSLYELAGRRPRRGDIARTAARWGFPDPAYFSRTFRSWFGFTPSDAAALGEASHGDS